MDNSSLKVISSYVDSCKSMPESDRVGSIVLKEACDTLCEHCNEVILMVGILLNIGVEDKDLLTKVQKWSKSRARLATKWGSCFSKKSPSEQEFNAFVSVLDKYNQEVIDLCSMFQSNYINDLIKAQARTLYVQAIKSSFSNITSDVKSIVDNISEDNKHIACSKVLNKDVLVYMYCESLLNRYAWMVTTAVGAGFSFGITDKEDTLVLRKKWIRVTDKGICIATRLRGRYKGKLLYVSSKSGSLSSNIKNAVLLSSLDEVIDYFKDDKNVVLKFVNRG